MTNGQSKKVFVGIVAMQQIATMADEPEQFPFAILIGVLAVGYMVKQTILDYLNLRKQNNGKIDKD